MNETVRWYMAVAYAASEVGGLMALISLIGLISGGRGPGILLDVVLIVGLAAWLWWRKSRVAAALVIAFVSYEYAFLWFNSSAENSWLRTYPILFAVALMAHGRKPKTAEPEPKGK